MEKNKNSLPDTAGPKKPKNPLAEEAKDNQEINGKRTVNSKTFKIGENAYKTEVYQTPVHYVNENNALVDIDNTLVESKAQDYAYENRANNVKVRFSEKATGNKLGQIRQNLFSLDWSLLDGKGAPGNTSRNTITYSGIAENTDLRYTVDGSALKEEIILHSPAAPTEFKFVLDLKNLTYKTREDGSIDFVEPRTGTTVWVMPKPFMYDARGERSEGVTAGLAEENGKPVLTVKADAEWLSATDRQFPVVIDPTLQPGGGDGRDTFISSQYHSSNFRAKDRLYVGNTPNYENTASFFYFYNLTEEENITITSATFSAYATEGSLTSINLYPVQTDWKWDTTTMTWDFWQQNRSLGKLIDTAGGPATGWWSFDVKALVQQWVDKPAANFGLALIPASGSGYKEFISCDYREKEKYQPKLVYTYTKDTQETVPANFQLHIDRKSGQIKADGTAVADARIYLNSDDGQSFTASADSSGKWSKDGMSFEKGKTRTISMYYEYEVEETDDQGNTTTRTERSSTTSQEFLIAIYSKQARTKKMAKFYYKDGTRAAQLKEDNKIKTELELVVGDYILVLDPLRDMPYTSGPIIKDPDSDYRLQEKIKPLYANSEVVGDSIDVVTGNFFALETDLAFAAQGVPVQITRAANSQQPEMVRGPLGINWDLDYNKMLVMYEDGSIEATGGDGGGYFFYPNGSGYRADPDVTERQVSFPELFGSEIPEISVS